MWGESRFSNIRILGAHHQAGGVLPEVAGPEVVGIFVVYQKTLEQRVVGTKALEPEVVEPGVVGQMAVEPGVVGQMVVVVVV